METPGITLALPIAFVTSAVYSALVARIIAPYRRLSRIVYRTSLIILALWVFEVVFTFAVDFLNRWEMLGHTFYAAHLVLFFLAVPSLANVILLKKRRGSSPKWYVVAMLCTGLALLVLLNQYHVSEALYGIG